MAMLTRPTNIKIFGSAALAAELTDFGGSTPSTDINTILNSVAAERGWGTVGANGFPPMEWFNALGYALSYYSAYIMQSGIPAWTSLQNYYVNSYTVGSDGKLYRSKTGVEGTPNVGNNPVGDTTNWESASDVAGAIHNATAKTTLSDNDEFGIWDSITGILKKITFSNLKLNIEIPTGNVAYFAVQTAPTGYLKANGAAVSRTTYAALFAAIGTTFGAGDGSTTFNLPDLRGYFLRAWDDGRGVDSGRAFGSSQNDDFKSHSHTVRVQQSIAGGGGYIRASETSTNGSADLSLVNATGGTETRPKNIALLACIKY